MEMVDNYMKSKGFWGALVVCVFGFFVKEHIKKILLFLICGVFLSKVKLYSFVIKEKNIKKAIDSFIIYEGDPKQSQQ